MRSVAGISTESLRAAGGRGVAGWAEDMRAAGRYVGGPLGDSLTAVSALLRRV